MRPQHSNRAPADAQKVNLYEPWEELYWGEKLRCTTDQLRAAVDAVGVSVAEVKAYLEKGRRGKGASLPPIHRPAHTHKPASDHCATVLQ